MSKPKYLYHGSGRKLIGSSLIPKKAEDLGGNKDNSLRGVYASSVREQAISMALHSSRGVGEGSLQMHKVNGKLKIKDSIIYKGWPTQKYVYLYILPSKTFRNIPLGSPQWVSLKSVKPIQIEKLFVKDYLYLVRKATVKERKEF
jgi:hypothetical protein